VGASSNIFAHVHVEGWAAPALFDADGGGAYELVIGSAGQGLPLREPGEYAWQVLIAAGEGTPSESCVVCELCAHIGGEY
jgi:hypothetical protein